MRLVAEGGAQLFEREGASASNVEGRRERLKILPRLVHGFGVQVVGFARDPRGTLSGGAAGVPGSPRMPSRDATVALQVSAIACG